MGKDSESLSLAETNRIRAGLGLAPLAGEDNDLDHAAVDGMGDDEDDDPDARAEVNWTEKRKAEAAARADQEARDRLAKAKNQRELRSKLQGKGLGAADEGTEGAAGGTSAAAWVKQSRKRAKERERELAKLRLREQELDDRDREAVYGEEDLAGLKVAHGAEAFEEGKDVVLTLSDRKVLDDGDDELQNVNLAEYARTAERMDIKKKGKSAYKYTGYDDDEFGDAAIAGKPRGVLSKYDAVIGEASGPRPSSEGFRLGSNVPVASTSRVTTSADGLEEQRQLNRDLLTLDYTKGEQNDYLQEGEVGFKVKKKKSKKSSTKMVARRVAGQNEDDERHVNGSAAYENGDVDMAAVVSEALPSTSTAERRLLKEASQSHFQDTFDDDELQSALARQRRQVNRTRIQQLRGEDIAQQMLDTRAQSMPVDDDEDVKPYVKLEEDVTAEGSDDGNGELVLNDTSEFVRNIALGSAVAKRQQGTATPVTMNAAGSTRSAAGTSKFKKVKTETNDGGLPLDQPLIEVKREDREEGEAGDDDHDSDDMSVDGNSRHVSTFGDKGKQRAVAGMDGTDGFGGTAAEKLVSGGLASTLSLLKQSGIVKTATPEELERERATREKERFIAEARRRDMEREADRARSKAAGANKTDAQREFENKQRQHEYAQKTLEAFKTYKPKVDIKYTDEFGRDMTPKEAWKDLSHKFHGKGSGTNKRAKLLKKVEDERKREAMASGDTPLAATAAFQARQERMGSATMIIGVGNKNAAPSADQLLGAAAASSPAVQLNKSRKADSPAPSAKRQKLQPRVLG